MRVLSLFSVAANIVLLAVALYSSRSSTAPKDPALELAKVPVQPSVFRAVHHRNHVPAAEPTTRSPWSKLESRDPRVFCANLRAVGCPEKTIRDIVLPVIERSCVSNATPKTAVDDFWNSREQTDAQTRASRMNDTRRDQCALALAHELFGVFIDRESLETWHRDFESGFLLGFLANGKPEQLIALGRRFHLDGRAVKLAAQDILTPEDFDQIDALAPRFIADVTALLSPTELDELYLRVRTAGLAAMFAERVLGVPMSPDELRALARDMNMVDATLLRFGAADLHNFRESAEEYEPALRQRLRAILDPERFAFYERLEDRGFREIALFGQEHELPVNRIMQVHEIVQQFEQERKRLAQQPLLSEAQREQALAVAAGATDESLRALLGDDLFRKLKKR